MTQAPAEIVALAEQRLEARLNKDWALSDALRAQIADAGWLVADSADGFSLSPKPPFEQLPNLSALKIDSRPLDPSLVSIDVIVDGWPDDVFNCLLGIVSFAPKDALITVLDCGNVDGVGEVIENAAKVDSRIRAFHIVPPLTVVGWSAAVTALLHINNAGSHVIVDIATSVLGDAISVLADALGDGVVASGWRGVNVNTADEWRTFDSVETAGEVDAVLSYLMAVDTAAARATPPHPKAKFYRNADLEWSLMLRAAGGKVVMPTNDLPCSQGRHHGYHDSDPEYRERESRKTYDRLLKSFRTHPEVLAPRK